jgi:hypothetical protein
LSPLAASLAAGSTEDQIPAGYSKLTPPATKACPALGADHERSCSARRNIEITVPESRTVPSTFFIKGRTEPIEGAGNKFGSVTFTILYDAPSKDAADQWAADFVAERLLRRHPEQRLTETLVAPVYSHLLTSDGEAEIDWPSFAIDAKDKYDKKERGCSMRFIAGRRENADSPALESPLKWIESVKARISDPDRFNWDERKRFFYVVYHSHQAHIVQAINMCQVSQIYSFCVQPASAEKIRLLVRSWPGATRWSNTSE